MTILQILNYATNKVKETSDSPSLDAEVLLSHVLDESKEHLLTNPNRVITPKQEKQFKILLARRLKNWPVAYLTNQKEFFGLKFYVDVNVLIPRPETELLVDEVLKYHTLHPKPLGKAASSAYTLLDIGTGAGNIAISIAKNLSLHPWGGKLNIIATDVSAKALKVARQNAKLHGVENQITFVHSDLLIGPNFTHLGRSSQIGKVSPDIIVTNLPYIPSARIPYLDPSVKDFEPLVALDGGEDGFDLYRKLFAQIKQKKWNPKLIVGEIDYTHGELAVNEALKFFPNAAVEVKTDLAHKQRILSIYSVNRQGSRAKRGVLTD